jgi:hypothetical protein
LTRSLRSSPERRLLAALFLAGAVLLCAAPVRSEDARAAAAEVLSDPRFQRELPARPPAPKSRNPDKSDKSNNDLDLPPDSGGGVTLPALGAGAVLGKALFLVLIAVALVLLVVWLAGAVLRRGSLVTDAPEEGGAPADEAPRREPTFDEAGKLAAEGRYAEAVHALLLTAIRHFAERSRVATEPSRTSRELVRLLPLGPETRKAFAELVRMVELSLFGGAAVGREDYERSLSRFQELTRRAA